MKQVEDGKVLPVGLGWSLLLFKLAGETIVFCSAKAVHKFQSTICEILSVFWIYGIDGPQTNVLLVSIVYDCLTPKLILQGE